MDYRNSPEIPWYNRLPAWGNLLIALAVIWGLCFAVVVVAVWVQG